jgi:hypothetical protein
MDGSIGRPCLLPFEVFIALRIRTDTGIAVIVLTAGDEGDVVIVRNGGVS